jgi:hypothetical protein
MDARNAVAFIQQRFPAGGLESEISALYIKEDFELSSLQAGRFRALRESKRCPGQACCGSSIHGRDEAGAEGSGVATT